MSAKVESPAEVFAGALEKLARTVRPNREGVLARLASWVKDQRVPSSVKPTVDLTNPADVLTDDRLLDMKDDRQASRYLAEATNLERQILADVRRLTLIYDIANPPAPRRIEGRDMLAVQVIAAGLCVSCFRYELTNKDREKDPRTGEFFYAESCRRCGGFKHDHGIYPPLVLLEAWHSRGKNWTAPMVAEALADAARPKVKT